MNRISGFLIPIVMLIGFELYQKDDTHDDVKQDLVEVCDYDEACTQTVNQYFEICFEQAYKTGGRRKAATLDMGKVLICLNQNAGEPIFGVERND